MVEPDPLTTYETARPAAYQWTENALKLLKNGDLTVSFDTRSDVLTAIVQGECPRCSHQFSVHKILTAVAGEPLATLSTNSLKVARKMPTWVNLTVSCACSEPHSGRPHGDGRGCGVTFGIQAMRPS